MISSVTGQLRRVDEDRVQVQVGPVWFELLVSAADVPLLQGSVGEETTFHTIFYLEGDAGGGNIEPRLVGFLRPEDRTFFQLFITVKGIGPRKALRALVVPVGEIAQAIESKDTRFLSGLKGVGKRTAELMIAELSGKVATFTAAAAPRAVVSERTGEDEAAIAVLTGPQMGLRRAEAEALLHRVKQASPDARSADQLVPLMLRLYAQRA